MKQADIIARLQAGAELAYGLQDCRYSLAGQTVRFDTASALREKGQIELVRESGGIAFYAWVNQ